MRKVEAFYYKDGEKVFITGYFHQWAAACIEYSDGPAGNYTVGLVEEESGQIRECPPEGIKFIK